MKKNELSVGESYALGDDEYATIGIYVGSDFPPIYRGAWSIRSSRSQVAQAVFAVKQWQNSEQRENGEMISWEPKVVPFGQVMWTQAQHAAAIKLRKARETATQNAIANREQNVKSFAALADIKSAQVNYYFTRDGRRVEDGVKMSYADFEKLAQNMMKLVRS